MSSVVPQSARGCPASSAGRAHRCSLLRRERDAVSSRRGPSSRASWMWSRGSCQNLRATLTRRVTPASPDPRHWLFLEPLPGAGVVGWAMARRRPRPRWQRRRGSPPRRARAGPIGSISAARSAGPTSATHRSRSRSSSSERHSPGGRSASSSWIAAANVVPLSPAATRRAAQRATGGALPCGRSIPATRRRLARCLRATGQCGCGGVKQAFAAPAAPRRSPSHPRDARRRTVTTASAFPRSSDHRPRRRHRRRRYAPPHPWSSSPAPTGSGKTTRSQKSSARWGRGASSSWRHRPRRIAATRSIAAASPKMAPSAGTSATRSASEDRLVRANVHQSFMTDGVRCSQKPSTTPTCGATTPSSSTGPRADLTIDFTFQVDPPAPPAPPRPQGRGGPHHPGARRFSAGLLQAAPVDPGRAAALSVDGALRPRPSRPPRRRKQPDAGCPIRLPRPPPATYRLPPGRRGSAGRVRPLCPADCAASCRWPLFTARLRRRSSRDRHPHPGRRVVLCHQRRGDDDVHVHHRAASYAVDAGGVAAPYDPRSGRHAAPGGASLTRRTSDAKRALRPRHRGVNACGSDGVEPCAAAQPSTPIKRTGLAAVILRMGPSSSAEVETSLPRPAAARAVSEALPRLEELGAIDDATPSPAGPQARPAPSTRAWPDDPRGADGGLPRRRAGDRRRPRLQDRATTPQLQQPRADRHTAASATTAQISPDSCAWTSSAGQSRDLHTSAACAATNISFSAMRRWRDDPTRQSRRPSASCASLPQSPAAAEAAPGPTTPTRRSTTRSTPRSRASPRASGGGTAAPGVRQGRLRDAAGPPSSALWRRGRAVGDGLQCRDLAALHPHRRPHVDPGGSRRRPPREALVHRPTGPTLGPRDGAGKRHDARPPHLPRPGHRLREGGAGAGAADVHRPALVRGSTRRRGASWPAPRSAGARERLPGQGQHNSMVVDDGAILDFFDQRVPSTSPTGRASGVAREAGQKPDLLHLARRRPRGRGRSSPPDYPDAVTLHGVALPSTTASTRRPTTTGSPSPRRSSSTPAARALARRTIPAPAPAIGRRPAQPGAPRRPQGLGSVTDLAAAVADDSPLRWPMIPAVARHPRASRGPWWTNALPRRRRRRRHLRLTLPRGRRAQTGEVAEETGLIEILRRFRGPRPHAPRGAAAPQWEAEGTHRDGPLATSPTTSPAASGGAGGAQLPALVRPRRVGRPHADGVRARRAEEATQGPPTARRHRHAGRPANAAQAPARPFRGSTARPFARDGAGASLLAAPSTTPSGGRVAAVQKDRLRRPSATARRKVDPPRAVTPTQCRPPPPSSRRRSRRCARRRSCSRAGATAMREMRAQLEMLFPVGLVEHVRSGRLATTRGTCAVR